MSKILVFLSSPRENGYTTQLVNHVLDGAKSAGGFFELYGWDVIESLLVYGNTSPDYEIPKELLDRAYEAGRKLVE